MTLQLSADEKMVFNAVKYLPAISVILPFEPKICLKTELDQRLKMAVGKVEKELMENYPVEKALPVLNRLRQLVKSLNYNSNKKSIAIFLSPVMEKVFYLDITVEEKIVIDESFEIRDLVYIKKQSVQYLVMLLSAKHSLTFFGTNMAFRLIKSNHADHLITTEKDFPERVANFSDPDKRAEILLDKFLHQMDQGLSLILKAYPLPVFVLGTEKVLGHYKKITKHEKAVVQFVHGNYEDSTETEIIKVIQPYVKDWDKVKQLDLLHQLEKAMDAKKLAVGIEAVWHTAAHKNCRLMVVEKDYVYAARLGGGADIIIPSEGLNNAFYIKDAVDDVMQKVLENGGDVEFVDNGVLQNYDQVALIQYY